MPYSLSPHSVVWIDKGGFSWYLKDVATLANIFFLVGKHMNILAHFRVITRHRHQVMKNCIKAGIGFQGLFHDLSKYSPAEFIPGVKNFQGNRSPNEKARERFGYSSAWLHHKGRNRHHYEYWNDFVPGLKKEMPVKMPVKYVIEMFCDRIAASKIYYRDRYDDSFPLDYYTRGDTRRFLHPHTADMLESLLHLLKNQGEKAAFHRCRALLKHEKKKDSHV